jgi:hypothetical protein
MLIARLDGADEGLPQTVELPTRTLDYGGVLDLR